VRRWVLLAIESLQSGFGDGQEPVQ
jgi:hypothetical protein